ncbi:NRDE family protein, partial [Arthrospira platensis SPKY2]
PKLARTRGRFQALLEADAPDAEFMALLADREPAPDDELPDTGIGPEWERLLSSPFIVSPHYGTRCSTLLRLGADGELGFVERRFGPAGENRGESARSEERR